MGGQLVYAVYGALAGVGAIMIALGLATANERYKAARTKLKRRAT